MHIHAGKDNWIDNNIFVNCKYAIGFMGWSKERWKQFFVGDEKVRRRSKIDITESPYSDKYPELKRMKENLGRNHIWRNRIYNCGNFFNGDLGLQDLTDNHIIDSKQALEGKSAIEESLITTASQIIDNPVFRPIPFDRIGLYKSEQRASLSVK